MKNINEVFSDKEHEYIKSVKGKSGSKNYHDFIILAVKKLEESLEASE